MLKTSMAEIGLSKLVDCWFIAENMIFVVAYSMNSCWQQYPERKKTQKQVSGLISRHQ